MRRKKASIQSVGIVVLLLVLMNAILIREAYTYYAPLYWFLLISVPLLLLAIQKLRSRRKEIKSFKSKEHDIRK